VNGGLLQHKKDLSTLKKKERHFTKLYKIIWPRKPFVSYTVATTANVIRKAVRKLLLEKLI